MPFTFNGIGTRYYGASAKSVIQGHCPSCGRFTRLASYETREFFCIVYVPVFPLGKYRILNDCPLCNRHQRVPFAQFQQDVEALVEPLRRAVQASPGDPEARAALVEGLSGLHLFNEAEREAREGLTLNPRHARLNRLLAQLIAFRGDMAGATPYYQQAVAAEPGNAESRTALGRHLLSKGENTEAARELEAARSLDPYDPQILYSLGQALHAEKRWPEALHALEQAASRAPGLAGDDRWLQRVKECKEAMGYPLSDQERKAGKQWGLFRRSLKPKRATGALDGRRIAALLVLIPLIVTVLLLGPALWKQRRIAIWFDNGLAQPVTVTLDGETFSLPPQKQHTKFVSPGPHTIVVASADKREMERQSVQIEELGLFDALSTDRMYVYNVAEANIYSREKIGYALDEANQTYEQTYVAFQRFFEQREVDYPFQEAPEEISVDSKSKGATYKVAFNVAKIDANELGLFFYNTGKMKDAERAFRRAIASGGCATPAGYNLARTLQNMNQLEAAVDEARKWIAACPESGIDPHEVYQDAAMALGREDALQAEYRARIAAHPNDAASHYLYGRLLYDPARAIPAYREAVRLDPSLQAAKVSLAYELLCAEQDAEAARILESIVSQPGGSSYAPQYAMAAIAAGATAHASEVLRAADQATQEEDFGLWRGRWLLNLSAGQLEVAERLYREHSRNQDPEDPQIWTLRTQLLRLQGDGEELDKALVQGRLRPGLGEIAADIRLERALAAGAYADAVAAVDELGEEASYLQRLYAASALLLAGDTKGAATRLAALESEIGSQPPGDRQLLAFLAMTRHLERQAPAGQVLDLTREAGFLLLPHAYFILGVRAAADGNPAAARAYFEKSRQRSLDLELPYLAAAARAKG